MKIESMPTAFSCRTKDPKPKWNQLAKQMSKRYTVYMHTHAVILNKKMKI